MNFKLELGGSSVVRAAGFMCCAEVGKILWNTRTGEGEGQDRGACVSCVVYDDGCGKHTLPVKAEIRKAMGKDVGDLVTVKFKERIESAKARPKRRGSS
jgi:Domain of unknown function (DUF1905)